MFFLELWIFYALFSFSVGNDQLKPGLIREFTNVFYNLSNLGLMPHLMETPNCRRDCEIYHQAFLQNRMWAAQMFDANGRQSLGILKGNLHQIGNIDQCMAISSLSEISNVEGKFCYIKILLKPSENNTLMKEIWKAAFNVVIITSKSHESYIAPTSDTIVSSLCVPSSCTAHDLTIASKKIMSVFNQTTFDFEVHVHDVNEENCIIKREYNSEEIHSLTYFINASSIRATYSFYFRLFIITMFILVSCATIINVIFPENVQNNRNAAMVLSKSFSLRQNLSTFMKVESDNDLLGCLNGLRCILYFFLFILHYTFKFLLFGVDRSDFFQVFRCPFIEAVLKNSLFVLDMLVFLSGISHSYKLTPFLIRNDKRSILNSMLYRYLRFLMFLLTFFFIKSNLTNKTQLHLLYTPTKSKSNFWSIIFCFENFYGFENMFFAPLHSFYTDVQLYLFCCILVLLLRHYNHNVKLLFSLAFGSLFCRSVFFYFYSDVQIIFFFGISFKQFTDLLSFMYMTPFSRLPYYLSGVALGYYFRKKSNHELNLSYFQFYKKVNRILPLLCLCIAIYLYYPTNSHHEYNSFDGAVLNFSNCLSTMILLIWVVWYCETFKELSSTYRFLSADTFVILNRLTPYFSAIHIVVLCKAFIRTRFLFEFKLSEILGLDYLLLTILVCVCIMLFIYLPLSNTWTYFIIRKDSTGARYKYE